MAPFPYPSMFLSNPESPSTPSQCIAAMNYSLPFQHLPSGTPQPQSLRNHSRFPQASGSPSNPVPIASFSGVPSPMLPNSPRQSRQVLSRSWTSNRHHALPPVLVTVCALPVGRAPVRPASPVLRVNRVRRVSSALNVNLVRPTVTSATRESQAPASASPPLSPTSRQPAIVSTVFAVPTDSVHATLAGLLVPMGPPVPRAQRASSRLATVTAKVGPPLLTLNFPANAPFQFVNSVVPSAPTGPELALPANLVLLRTPTTERNALPHRPPRRQEPSVLTEASATGPLATLALRRVKRVPGQHRTIALSVLLARTSSTGAALALMETVSAPVLV